MLDSNKKHKEKLINYLSLINDKNLINSEIPLFYEIILLILILVISIFSRFYQLSTIPGTINRDEAFQGYIAYTLLKFGVDSYGKRFPVYLTVWGDGASVLQSIIEIPFIYFMDLTVFAIRIPTAICSVINLLIVYLMIKKFKGNQIALFSTYLLTISPYHIMIARWSLDCNLAPYFLTLGLYFFIKGADKDYFFILSACFYGLSLYCYANIWLVLPFIILIQMIYFYMFKQVKINIITFFSVIILFLFALPLMIFLLVNKNLINEIQLKYMTIPKLINIRTNEIKFNPIDILINIYSFIKIIISQNDEYIHNVIPTYGFYYKTSLFFLIIGFIYCYNKIKEGNKNKKITLEFLLIIYIIAGIVVGILIKPNINRINIIFIPLIIISSFGIIIIFKNKRKLIIIPIIIYSIQFINFEYFYFSKYNYLVHNSFFYQIDKAIQFIKNDLNYNSSIALHIENYKKSLYPAILFYLKQDINNYLNTVIYKDKNDSLLPLKYENIYFYYRTEYKFSKSNITDNSYYLLVNRNHKIKKKFQKLLFKKKKFGYFYVYYK